MWGWLWIVPASMFFCCVVVNFLSRPWNLIKTCQKQGIPGYPFYPFVGQIPQISKVLNLANSSSGPDWEALKIAQQCVKERGKVFYFSTGKVVRLCVAEPDLLKDVLSGNADSYAKPSFVHVLDILGDGLFSSSGQMWARQRQLLGLSFASKEIKTEVGIITNIAKTSLKKWSQDMESGKAGEVNIYRKMLELTLTVIEKLAFGAAPAEEGDSSALAVTKTFDRYLHNCRELVFGRPASIPNYWMWPSSLNREISRDQKWLAKVIEELIKARSKYNALKGSEEKDSKDVLDLLMGSAEDNSSKEGLSQRQLRDNGLTILLAGHHTIASLLAWTMYMLAVHPEWQDRARAEVEGVCKGGVVEWATLSRLKTLTMLVQETLRLYPPVPLIGRLCAKENIVGPFAIPPGLEIMVPTAVIHRDKELWGEDAEEFVPTRFENGIGKACKHIMGYMPFGFGPRTCVGQTLALAEARAVLALILTTFTWKLSPGYRHCPDVSLTLLPKFDIPIIMDKLK